MNLYINPDDQFMNNQSIIKLHVIININDNIGSKHC